MSYEPINYNVDVQTQFQAALQGYQAGAAIRNDQFQQQQQQTQLAQQQQAQQMLQRLVSNPNPTADDYAAATLVVPGMREQFKQAWDMRSTARQQNDLQHVGEVYSAIVSGQPQVGADLLRQRAQALRNSGDEGAARNADAMAGVIDQHPQFARTIIGMKLSAIPGGDKVISNVAALHTDERAQDQAPAVGAKLNAEASEAGSKAVTAAVAAGNAPTATELGNQKTAQEIRASQLAGDISRLNVQIAQANSETERGRLTLERDKLTAEQAKLNQTQAFAAQDSQNLSSQALQTLATIKQHPGMDGYFTAPGSKWGSVWRYVPGSDRQALEGWIDSLKGQLGYSNLMAAKASSPTGASGFGALSDSELKLLSNLAGNLDPNSADFPRQLASVERYLQKAQATAVSRPQLPNKGEAFVLKHPVYGNVDEGQINALMRQFPGSTRKQILTFLQQTGGR